jgi:hypothetical protein
MPAGNTYEAIATQTLGSAAASVTFSSIPQTYTDLMLIIIGNAGGSTSASMRFNSDTGTNYSNTYAQGDGSGVGNFRDVNVTSNWAGSFYNTTTPSTAKHSIMNYANTTTFKSSIIRADYGIGFTVIAAQLWRNTAAITSITLATGANFSTGATFSLYGIKAA